MEDLKEKYQLSPDNSQKIFKRIKDNATCGLKPAQKPTAYIVIGQPGSGKTTFSINKVKTDGNILRIDGDGIRDSHPSISELKKRYPEKYCFIIEPDAGKWKRDLFLHGVTQRYNIIIEVSTKNIDSLISFIFSLKKANYDIVLLGLAVNKLESMLSVFERYCTQVELDGTGRIGDFVYHNKAYDNIMYVLLRMIRLQLCRIEIYRRDGNCVYDSENTKVQGKYQNPYEAMGAERMKGLPRTVESFKKRYAQIAEKLLHNDGVSSTMQTKLDTQMKQLMEEYTRTTEQGDCEHP